MNAKYTHSRSDGDVPLCLRMCNMWNLLDPYLINIEVTFEIVLDLYPHKIDFTFLRVYH